MNFQDLKSVEEANFYFDVAIKRTKKKIDLIRKQTHKGNPLFKSKKIELTKLESIESEINQQLTKILISYPSFDNLPEFYQQLIRLTIDLPYLKKSLASIKWCTGKNKEFLKKYKEKIKHTTEISRMNQYRREFYGRIGSTLKQIKPHLAYLEKARRIMLSYPSIKTSLATIAIAGFPNVGKTTLLSKITTSTPEIKNYAFTTKGINQGFATINKEKVQFLDTPGTLNRFEKQNTIEKVANIAIKYVAEAIIYVFDLTEVYPLEKQIRLYNQLKKTKKPILIYLAKTDITDEDTVNKFKKKYKTLNVKELKKEIEKLDII